MGQVPSEECKPEPLASFHIKITSSSSPCKVLEQEIGEPSELGQALSKIAVQALKREKLELAVRVLARVVQGVASGRRESCERAPSAGMLELAVRMMIKMASRSAVEALQAGKLRGLGAQEKNGVVWVSGRIRGDKLAVLLGVEALPVLLPSERLAQSIMGRAPPRGP